jgi:hypothetical protein
MIAIYFLTVKPLGVWTAIYKQSSRWWCFNSHYRQPGFLQPQIRFRTLFWVCMGWDSHCWWHKYAYLTPLLFAWHKTGNYYRLFSPHWKLPAHLQCSRNLIRRLQILLVLPGRAGHLYSKLKGDAIYTSTCFLGLRQYVEAFDTLHMLDLIVANQLEVGAHLVQPNAVAETFAKRFWSVYNSDCSMNFPRLSHSSEFFSLVLISNADVCKPSRD